MAELGERGDRRRVDRPFGVDDQSVEVEHHGLEVHDPILDAIGIEFRYL